MKRRSNYETTPIKVVILVMTRERFLLLIYFDWFVASFTFSLTTRSGIEVAQVVQNLPICHGQKLHCISRQCQEWERDTSWQASTPEELEWKQPRTGISSSGILFTGLAVSHWWFGETSLEGQTDLHMLARATLQHHALQHPQPPHHTRDC